MARRFEIIEGADNLYRIRESWEALNARNDQAAYFNSYAWFHAFANNLEPDPDSIVCVLAYRGDELEAIFPLQFRRKGLPGLSLNILQAPQHPHVNLHDVVVAGHQDHSGLIHELVRYLQSQKHFRCDALWLGNVLESSATLRMLREDSRFTKTIFASSFNDSLPVMAREDLLSTLSKNMKRSLRSAFNKLSRHESVEYLETRDPELLPDYLAAFLDVEASGWKGASGSGTAIKLDSALTGFYSDLAKGFGSDRNCEIGLLKINGRVAAGQFALIVGKTMYSLKIGYSEEYSRCSPGSNLMIHRLDRLHAEGEITDINLVSDAAWHRGWRPQQQPVYKACVYTNGLSARLLVAYGYLRQAAKRLYDDYKGRGLPTPHAGQYRQKV